MKNQVLFSWKDKSKKSKCRLLQFLFGALGVKCMAAFFFFFEFPYLRKYEYLFSYYKTS